MMYIEIEVTCVFYSYKIYLNLNKCEVEFLSDVKLTRATGLQVAGTRLVDLNRYRISVFCIVLYVLLTALRCTKSYIYVYKS